MNLLLNAAEAMPRGGRLRSTSRNGASVCPSGDARKTDLTPFVVIRVRDTGEGIGKESGTGSSSPSSPRVSRGRRLASASGVKNIVQGGAGASGPELEHGGSAFRVFLPTWSGAPPAHAEELAGEAHRPDRGRGSGESGRDEGGAGGGRIRRI